MSRFGMRCRGVGFGLSQKTCLSLDSGDLVRVLFDRKKIPTPAEFTEDCRYELQIAPQSALGFS